jgi:hypothetical protein
MSVTPRKRPGEKTVDPAAITPQSDNFDGLADVPPPISGYRKADVAGIACWNCGHFSIVGDPDGDGDVDGICNLFEAKADGDFTCDRFTAHADLLRQSPHTSWTEDMANRSDIMGPSVASVDWSDNSTLNELAFEGAGAVEEEGLVWKDILRSGTWTHMPTNKGLVKQKLSIVAEGESDPDNGVISLSELQSNFDDGAVPYVTVPLSDDTKDHKNIARLNTGFVRKLRMLKKDGKDILQAGIDFTEPEVKAKVLRGTIPDCSAGVPFDVTRRKDNKTFKTVLDHVCLTSKPFMDGLGPFGIEAADSEAEPLPVDIWEEEDVKTRSSADPPPAETEESNPPSLSFNAQREAALKAIRNQLGLGPDYVVQDIDPGNNTINVFHKTANIQWDVPFKFTNDADSPIRLAAVNNWKIVEQEQEEETPAVVTAADVLRNAQELRELRLAQPTGNTGGVNMSLSAPSLEGVELSDEARARVQSIIKENENLRRSTRTSKVDERVAELSNLEGLMLSERPGALKLYRDVMLSDDGGAAAVLFSDGDESKQERLTAIEILDRFIDALKADGGVVFSDQALQSGNDKKPPATPEGERAPLDERFESAKTALYGSGKRRTGRK